MQDELITMFAQACDLLDIFAEIAYERLRQDEIYGGPEYDDNHTHRDWVTLIDTYTSDAWYGEGYYERREAFVKAAALAVAAIQSLDRKE